MTERDAVDDVLLALQAAGGAQSAFSELMRRHSQPLYRFVLRHIPNDDVAADIVQESFVSAWLAMDRFDPTRPFPVWLRAIAFNKCRDHGRRRRVRRSVIVEAANDSETLEGRPDTAPSPERSALDADQLRRLGEETRKLPDSLREVFLLAGFEELTIKETAELLGVTAKSVEMRLYRARAKLAKVLNLTDEPR